MDTIAIWLQHLDRLGQLFVVELLGHDDSVWRTLHDQVLTGLASNNLAIPSANTEPSGLGQACYCLAVSSECVAPVSQTNRLHIERLAEAEFTTKKLLSLAKHGKIRNMLPEADNRSRHPLIFLGAPGAYIAHTLC